MSDVPLELPSGCPVLVAGAGGGFDFLCGLPIVLELEARGHPVVIANYSFTRLPGVRGAEWRTEHLLEVGPGAELDDEYFPERDLCAWYQTQAAPDRRVFCLARQAVPATRDSYRWLVSRFGLHAVLCVDGGVDGIFRGDEADLATPSMDAASVIAASLSGAPVRVYVTTAFGVEGAEGSVSHGQALQRMADLIRQDAFLGIGAVRRQTAVGRAFAAATDFVLRRLPPVRRSVIVSALRAAMDGACGPTVVSPKTVDRQPWLSPLTPLHWYFDADAVARMKLYHDEALEAPTLEALAAAIERARERAGVKPRVEIPI